MKQTIHTPNGMIVLWLGADGKWYLVAQEYKNSYIEKVDICLTTETIKILVTQLMQLGEHIRVNDND